MRCSFPAKPFPSLGLTLLLGLCSAGPSAIHAAISEADLLPVEQAFQLQAHAVNRGWIEFNFKVTPGYYLYRERIKVTSEDGNFSISGLHLPPGEIKDDPNFGRMEVYHHDLTGKLTGSAQAGASSARFKVAYQGCADIGICYPPQRMLVDIALPAGGASVAGDAATPKLDLAPPAPLIDLLGSADTAASLTDPAAPAQLPLPPEIAFPFDAIALGEGEILARFSLPKGYYLYRDRSQFALADPADGTLGIARWPTPQTFDDPEFGVVPVFFDVVEVPIHIARNHPQAATITLSASFQGCEQDGVCYPPMQRSVAIEFAATSTEQLATASRTVQAELAVAAAAADQDRKSTPAAATISLWRALLLALLGGLILNLMPCVLPVLSLKAMSLAQAGETPESAHRHALWYTGGVMVAFAAIGLLVLGLRVGGQALGWGFQLQQPVVVALMAFVMVVLGLSLSGVVTLGSSLTNIGSGLAQHNGPKGDFFTGVLAVIVASPCTAPFMGGALAFAFTQPSSIALLVFLALGLGLALPFLLIGFIPGLAQRLPKPGAWMETLKQLLAFPLYLTAVWLAWVLGHQRGADAMALWLAGTLALIAGLWWWERGRYRDFHHSRWIGAALMIGLALASVAAIHGLPASAAISRADADSEPWSAPRLAELRASGRPVFVNMTADWCLSCKVNERTTLGSQRFRKLLQDTGTVYLKGDWTNEDSAISAFLKEQDAVGVPLYVYFAPGSQTGIKLPAVLTPELVEQVLGAGSAED
ncbi:MAG: protein-disulfide reductase DsbD family protein [Lysobacterales bacterium]